MDLQISADFIQWSVKLQLQEIAGDKQILRLLANSQIVQ